MRKKNLTVNEIFCGMPHLKKWFQEQERLINKFGAGNGDNPAVQELKKTKDALLKIAENMDIEDLRVVSYVNNIKKLKPYAIVGILRSIDENIKALWDIQKELKEERSCAKTENE